MLKPVEQVGEFFCVHLYSSIMLIVLQIRQQIGNRAFSVTTPSALNRAKAAADSAYHCQLKTLPFLSVYGHRDTDLLRFDESLVSQ